VAAVFDVKVKGNEVASRLTRFPTLTKAACSAVHGLGLISGAQAMGATRMGWNGILRYAKRRHLLSGGDGEPAGCTK
jgi:hypothetical protein